MYKVRYVHRLPCAAKCLSVVELESGRIPHNLEVEYI